MIQHNNKKKQVRGLQHVLDTRVAKLTTTEKGEKKLIPKKKIRHELHRVRESHSSVSPRSSSSSQLSPMCSGGFSSSREVPLGRKEPLLRGSKGAKGADRLKSFIEEREWEERLRLVFSRLSVLGESSWTSASRYF